MPHNSMVIERENLWQVSIISMCIPHRGLQNMINDTKTTSQPWSLNSGECNQGDSKEEAGKLNEWNAIVLLLFYLFVWQTNVCGQSCRNMEFVTRIKVYIHNYWCISQNFKLYLLLVSRLWIQENKVVWEVHQCSKPSAFTWC